jgi:hypothetical protein
MNDTSPEIAAMVHARLMAKTGEERFLMGIRMHETAHRMVMASFPPGISDQQRKKLLFERFYGADQRNGNCPAPNAWHFHVAYPAEA